MGDRKPTSLQAAIGADQSARALGQTGRAATGAAAGEDGGEAVQLAMFEGSSVFGTLKDADGKPLPSGGRGRPKGSRNRTTQDLIRLISETGRHPIIAMAEIVATPIDVIAKTLGCKKIEAAEYHRKVMSDLAPYVAQKLPQAVQITGANAGMLMIVDTRSQGQIDGLDLVLAKAQGPVEDIEEYQEVSEGDGAASNGEASNGQVKVLK